MKKTTLALAACALCHASFGQVEPTSYRGAFAPAPTVAWTNGWVNYTPTLTSYPATNTPVPAGDITTNTTWTKDKVYELQGYVFVKEATLTIEAGTIIRSTGKAALVITRGAKIMAEGTKDAPIIFTSNKSALQRTYGDWAGLVICGAAQHNLPLGVDAKVEGDILATHGGSNDDDNSGILKYVRIEFPGQALSSASNSEINGLSLYSVGRGTVIDYVQVSYSGDDAYEWFGGTVNAKHLVAFRTWDDDLDTDNGYRGTVQYAVVHRDPAVADQSGSNGFESDNNSAGSAAVPQTAPTFSNITLIGPKYNGGPTPAADYKRMAHIRRNSACSILNSILIGYPESGLLLDGRKTVANAVEGRLMFKNNFVANNNKDFNLASNSDTLGVTSAADLETWATSVIFGNKKGTTSESAELISPFSLINPDYRPKEVASVLEPTTFRGAFAPAPATAWTDGWVNYTPTLTSYPATNTPVPAGDITTNTTWTKDKVYELQGYVFVKNATLTIEAGTIIRSTGKAALVITRGAKIMAEGTKDAPIIFTSNKSALQRTYGDWAGLVICGAAQHNLPLGVDAKVEGDILATHGGSNDDDNSGILKYVRIEFPGQALSSASNSEINGLSMYSVGRGTVIDYVQVSYSGDDAYEWFGGTVNAKHLVAFRTWDDDLDTDNGYRGTVQYAVVHRDPAVADQSGSNGFESDNNSAGSAALPQTAPTFSNITLIGPKYTGGPTPAADYKRMAHIRRNSSTSIINSILIGYPESGLLIDGRKTVANAVKGTLMFKNNFVANNGINFNLANGSDTLGISSASDVATWATNPSMMNEVGATSESAGLINPFTLINPDYRPADATGIENDIISSNTEAMLVYPNPATTQVKVAVSKLFANATINIQNAMGATIATETVSEGMASFDTSGLTNGLYFMTLNNGNKVMSKTVVINR